MTLRLAVRNLFRNPRRALLVFVTLAVGASALLAFRAFNRGVLAEYREDSIRSRFGHGTIYPKGYWGKSLEEPWKFWIAEPSGLVNELHGMSEVAQVFPRVSFSALVTDGRTTLNGQGLGIDAAEEERFFDRLNIVKGEFLKPGSHQILLGRGLAESLGASVGTTVTLTVATVRGSMNAGVFPVGGIFETGVKVIDDVAFRTELTDAQKLVDTGAVESISIALSPGSRWEDVKDALSGRNDIDALSFEELDQTYYQNGVRWLKSQAGVFELIILLIVLLGIFNAVAISILERAPELGTARANGESRWSLFQCILWEALFLGLGASALGMAGAWLTGSSLLSGGIPMPPPPGMTRASQVFLEFTWGDAWTVGYLCVGTVITGASIMAVKVLRGEIVKNIRPY